MHLTHHDNALHQISCLVDIALVVVPILKEWKQSMSKCLPNALTEEGGGGELGAGCCG